eukprot:CAMPEP_0198136844 /NCGR_PEP_ID=MMETSP1443-20131203/419_1 /TAXON_ID=186043 /ORGANISM="Entomoneis sp., Strain CCMP2396" /LENGTH=188 /DNA_ID=CAMNT_0043798123 /DNA_START=114 /DNA_END=680 /DNA_ORIENTATION=+
MNRLSTIFIFALFYLLPACQADPEADLLKAALANDLPGIQAALGKGADVNVKQSGTGQTPLMGAVLNGHSHIVQFLLTLKDVDVTIPEKDGYTPAHGAGFQGRADIMRFLMNAGVNVKDDMHTDGFAPLHRACWGGHKRHTDTIRFLRDEAGVDVRTLPSKEGYTCEEMTQNTATLALLSELVEGDEF